MATAAEYSRTGARTANLHVWAFVGESPGRLLIAYTPAGRIQEWFERDRKKGEYVNDAALYHAFGMELLGPLLSLK